MYTVRAPSHIGTCSHPDVCGILSLKYWRPYYTYKIYLFVCVRSRKVITDNCLWHWPQSVSLEALNSRIHSLYVSQVHFSIKRNNGWLFIYIYIYIHTHTYYIHYNIMIHYETRFRQIPIGLINYFIGLPRFTC